MACPGDIALGMEGIAVAGERADLEPTGADCVEVGLAGGFRRQQSVDVDVGVAWIVAGPDLDAIEPGFLGDVEDGLEGAVRVKGGEDSELPFSAPPSRAGGNSYSSES